MTTKALPTRSARRTSLAVLAAATAAALAVTGCSADADPDASRPATGSGAATTGPGAPEPSAGVAADVRSVPLDPGIDHAHGLIVASDRTLLAGTHSGVVAIAPDGRVTRVGSTADDLMGMTGIPGTDRLVSSGHPGPGSDLPNPVGLIVSDDGGVTWTSVSLTGLVDFHALATDGTNVVGFDGRAGLLVSADGGATFEPGAPIAPAALAVTPAGVWATTADGVQHSGDGHGPFTAVDGAPFLVLIAAGSDGSLWGIDTDGVAWRSPDGTEWERRAAVGPADALAVESFDRAYAVTAEVLHALT
jgi:hypothetical protein